MVLRKITALYFLSSSSLKTRAASSVQKTLKSCSCAEAADGLDAFEDGFVVPAGGFGEQQDAELFGVGGASGEQTEKGKQEKAVVFDHEPLDARRSKGLSIDARVRRRVIVPLPVARPMQTPPPEVP